MIDRKEDNQFHLVSKYEPSGDQPQAIEALVDNIEGGEKAQILKGATGTGKTYTMSQVIQRVNKPTLVIAHNKTLAGQLYGEFKEFFPDNAVEYFVSYYDFYQPEAYVPSSDTYIEKDSSVNDEIDKLRHSATSALLERNDVIVRPKNMPIQRLVFVLVKKFLEISCSMTWLISSLSEMTLISNVGNSVYAVM